ncbi:YaiI/YqxD family protein [Paenibacillus pasadenensis]|uniref:YaiI/YqxD family protein n=1 Tax=Paenibacillus pasadenensis TaxID=217090 RepID=UPI002041CC22|nr:YaiI/YqxD family protein [Paenibacillus pasadenensis]MCM3746353.1 YaiI/YqxD family protein [Paenibacillus pasadenensis]
MGDLRIVVDADACPVKREIMDVAFPMSVPVLMVASYDHHLQPEPGMEIAHVDRSSQSADLYILNRVGRGDIVVTGDYGLAAVALAKGAQAIGFRGKVYRDETMDALMAQRHEHSVIRRSGGRTKGPKPMTAEDKTAFQQKLTKLLLARQENV